jgi:hypothetical protein
MTDNELALLLVQLYDTPRLLAIARNAISNQKERDRLRGLLGDAGAIEFIARVKKSKG